MKCTEATRLIHGYVDGELDLVRSVEVEEHLADCGSCLRALNTQRDLKASIRVASLHFEAPRGMEKRMRKALRQEHRQALLRAGWSWRRMFASAPLALGVAAIALFAFITGSLVRSTTGARMPDIVANEVVSGHVRSLMASHLFDIAATDQHTVKPWFTGKIDFSPPVVDLADKGFPLIGGRLDYLSGRPVAALVYQRRKHIINVFIWPTSASEARGPSKSETLRGFHVNHWSLGNMTCYAVSDVSMGDLLELSQKISERAGLGDRPR